MNTNIPYRERYYVCYSEETYQEFVDFIKSLKNVPKKIEC